MFPPGRLRTLIFIELGTAGEAMASRSITTRVLVVGGGPVGLTLAIDLASRGIDVVVAELRHAGEPPSVKCNHVSARSMEIYRRLGLAQQAARRRSAGGLPQRRRLSHHHDRARAVAHPDSLPARPLHGNRRPRHLVADARAAASHQSDLHGAGAVRARPADAAASSILNRTSVEGFTQDQQGIVATRAISTPARR